MDKQKYSNHTLTISQKSGLNEAGGIGMVWRNGGCIVETRRATSLRGWKTETTVGNDVRNDYMK